MDSLLCVQPGRLKRSLMDILRATISSSFVEIPNLDNEDTRRMFVYNATFNAFYPADVPVSRIRLLDSEHAFAISILNDGYLRKVYVMSLLESDSLKHYL